MRVQGDLSDLVTTLRYFQRNPAKAKAIADKQRAFALEARALPMLWLAFQRLVQELARPITD